MNTFEDLYSLFLRMNMIKESTAKEKLFSLKENDYDWWIKDTTSQYNNNKADLEGKKLFHIFGFMRNGSEENLKDVLINGLKISDNGEANGIWFTVNTTFTDDNSDRPLILSLNVTLENVLKYHLNLYDIENNANATIVRKNIPIEDLNIEQLAFGYCYFNQNRTFLLTADYLDSLFSNRPITKDLHVVIYEDLFDMWAKKELEKTGIPSDLNIVRNKIGDMLTIQKFL